MRSPLCPFCRAVAGLIGPEREYVFRNLENFGEIHNLAAKVSKPGRLGVSLESQCPRNAKFGPKDPQLHLIQCAQRLLGHGVRHFYTAGRVVNYCLHLKAPRVVALAR